MNIVLQLSRDNRHDLVATPTALTLNAQGDPSRLQIAANLLPEQVVSSLALDTPVRSPAPEHVYCHLSLAHPPSPWAWGLTATRSLQQLDHGTSPHIPVEFRCCLSNFSFTDPKILTTNSRVPDLI